jgi:uncharacterized membrane-anchored protein YhcB (DUF1043 family)
LTGGGKLGNEKKVVKGGFRATLALIISIVALLLAVLSYNRAGSQEAVNDQLKSLQKKVQELTAETSQKLEKARAETGAVLEKLGKSIKNEGK